MISQGLENFLDYLRATEQQLHIAEQSEQEANDATQDILHRLELCDLQDEEARGADGDKGEEALEWYRKRFETVT